MPNHKDSIVTAFYFSAFFGLDNGLPGIMCNQVGSQLDGMPVNFISH